MRKLPTEFTIKEHPSYWGFKIKVVEKHYSATFIAEIAHDFGRGWSEEPIAVFYQSDPPHDYSNYFGLFSKGKGDVRIIGVEDFNPWVSALLTPENEVIYSSYRHDMFYDTTGKIFIDGGRDYIRCSGYMALTRAIELNLHTKEIRVPKK